MIDHISYDKIKELLPDGQIYDLRLDLADVLNYLIDKINKELEDKKK